MREKEQELLFVGDQFRQAIKAYYERTPGVVKRFHDDLAALGSKARVGFTSLEGYIAGRVAVEATRLAAKGGGGGRAAFKNALAELNLDLGGYRVRFTPQSEQGSRFVDVVAIDRSGRVIG